MPSINLQAVRAATQERDLPAAATVPRTPQRVDSAAQTVGSANCKDPGTALEQLLEAALIVSKSTPYVWIAPATLDNWLLTWFGPISSMPPREARIAADMLWDAGCGMALGCRMHAHQLAEKLERRT